MEAEQNGKCISCGFLAQWDAHMDGPPPHLYEYPTKDREIPMKNGEIRSYTVVRLGKEWSIDTIPRCYIDCDDIWSEIDKLQREKSTTRALAAVEVFTKDRKCQKWYPYTPGFSPQEHWEEVRMQELELIRQAFELKLFEMNRSLNEKADTSNRRVTCVLIVFAILEVVFGAASVLQLAYPSGWPWLINLLGSAPQPLSIPTIPGGF